jgi:conjugal transfer pilus assembly protein TrbC
MKATTDAVMGLVKAGITEGVQIDPTLYSQYNIRSVPALVVRCKAGFDVIQGNIRLKQALEKVVDKGDCAETARKLLEVPDEITPAPDAAYVCARDIYLVYRSSLC